MDRREVGSGVSLKWQRDGSLTSSSSNELVDINVTLSDGESELACFPSKPILRSSSLIIDRPVVKPSFNVTPQPPAGISLDASRESSHRYAQIVKDHREREARTMQDLNQRLATHIEKVRFFECQNRSLAEEMDLLKRKWNDRASTLNVASDAQLQELKRRLDESERELSKLDANVATLTRQLDAEKLRSREISELYDMEKKKRLEKEAKRYELDAEIMRLGAQQDDTEVTMNKLRNDNSDFRDTNTQLKTDLDMMALKKREAERKLKVSCEQQEALKSMHEEEMNTISALAFKDSTADNRAMWQSEMAHALQEIQKAYEEKMAAVHAGYDDRVAAMQTDIETRYRSQMENYENTSENQTKDIGHLTKSLKKYKLDETEMKAKLKEDDTELKHLRNQLETQTREYEKNTKECEADNKCLRSKVKRLNMELDATLDELEGVLQSNPYLDMEITAYRTLLDRGESDPATPGGSPHR